MSRIPFPFMEALLHHRMEELTAEQQLHHLQLTEISNVVIRAMEGATEPATGAYLPMTFTAFAGRIYEAVESSEQGILLDEFIRIALYTTDALRRIVANPSYKLEKETCHLPPSRVQAMDGKTMVWLARQAGRSVQERIAPRNKIKTEKTIFSFQTKENSHMVYLYEILHDIIQPRCQQVDTVDHVKLQQFLALRRKIKDGDLGRVLPSRQTVQNNKLMCDKSYKIVWNGVRELQEVEEKLQLDWVHLEQRLSQIALWYAIGKLLHQRSLYLIDFAGTLQDAGGCLSFAPMDGIQRETRLYDDVRRMVCNVSPELQGVGLQWSDGDWQLWDVPTNQSLTQTKAQWQIDASPVAAEKPTMETCALDCLNGWYGSMEAPFQTYPMATYFSHGRTLYPCGKEGIYPGRQYTCYHAFGAGDAGILRRSIHDTVDGLEASGLLALVPDSIESFNGTTTGQLTYHGQRIFPVPRSVALAYFIGFEQQEDVFHVLDLDGPEVVATELMVERDAQSQTSVLIRKGRIRWAGKAIAYPDLAAGYWNAYLQKNPNLQDSASLRKKLIDNKEILRCWMTQSSIVVDTEDGYTQVGYDRDIMAQLERQVSAAVAQFASTHKKPVYTVSAIGGDHCMAPAALMEGSGKLWKKWQNHQLLWREYLPDLKLEVVRDGHFDKITLIGDQYRSQSVTVPDLNTFVTIPVTNGTITLPAGDNTVYYLPLKRERYASQERNKLAKFTLSGPLKKDTTFQLRVEYRYGDESSYQLVAYNDVETLKSQWCDEDDKKLANPVPSFQAQESAKGVDQEVVGYAREGFVDFMEKLTGRHHYSDNAALHMSKGEWLFFKLNCRGDKPYYPRLRRYFDQCQEAEWVRLYKSGVLLGLRKVMEGILDQGNEEKSTACSDFAKNIGCTMGKLFANDYGNIELASFAQTTAKTIIAHGEIVQLIPQTKWVSLDEDRYGIWDGMMNCLQTLNWKQFYHRNQVLQSMSAVCWKRESWVFDLYRHPLGKPTVAKLCGGCLDYVKHLANMPEAQFIQRENPRRIRDILEFFLCFCRLRRVMPDLLDCNAHEVKSAVKYLKRVDAMWRNAQETNPAHWSRKFSKSHLGFTPPNAYCQMHPTIYCLVETLSGGTAIQLIGFQDND